MLDANIHLTILSVPRQLALPAGKLTTSQLDTLRYLSGATLDAPLERAVYAARGHGIGRRGIACPVAMAYCVEHWAKLERIIAEQRSREYVMVSDRDNEFQPWAPTFVTEVQS